MSNLFSDLQKAKAEQTLALSGSTALLENAENSSPKQDAQKVAHKVEQMSKPLSKGMSKPLSSAFSQEAVEELAFMLRKRQQAKINATIPIEWKDKLDQLAFRLKVGKYELLTYMVGVFLGEVEEPRR
ncbi:MAG: hypothetical protein R3E39_32110 [Anaerolineae bacterium]